jgi:predicted transglutaminase-like cysteine proteinase
MLKSRNLRTCRAIAAAWALCLISAPTEPIRAVEEISRSKEPFAISTVQVTTGTLLDKWLAVEREIEAESLTLKICEENRASCSSQAALEFLAIVDSGRLLDGRARLGEINRATNLKIKPMSDLALYGMEDFWSSPLATLAMGAGDCEDYAIAKFVALQEAGISADDLRIVVMRDDARKEDHAVVAARLNGSWLMLDNLHMTMVEDQYVGGYFRPIFLLDRDGVKRYLSASSTSEGACADARWEGSGVCWIVPFGRRGIGGVGHS